MYYHLVSQSENEPLDFFFRGDKDFRPKEGWWVEKTASWVNI